MPISRISLFVIVFVIATSLLRAILISNRTDIHLQSSLEAFKKENYSNINIGSSHAYALSRVDGLSSIWGPALGLDHSSVILSEITTFRSIDTAFICISDFSFSEVMDSDDFLNVESNFNAVFFFNRFTSIAFSSPEMVILAYFKPLLSFYPNSSILHFLIEPTISSNSIVKQFNQPFSNDLDFRINGRINGYSHSNRLPNVYSKIVDQLVNSYPNTVFVFYTPPYYQTFLSHDLIVDNMNVIHSFFKTKDYFYIDFNQYLDISTDESYFSDVDHLNGKGFQLMKDSLYIILGKTKVPKSL